MKKVRFAIVGCGSISKKHIESIKRIDKAELACVCDKDENIAQRLAHENSVNYYTDMHQMALREKMDVFTILTPSGNHTDIIKELSIYNKDFVVEKPLGLDMGKINEVIDICNKRNLRLFVVHQNRFNRPVRALKKAIDGNRFGKLILGTVRVRWTRTQEYYDAKTWRGTRELDGGVLDNQANHHVDMLLWMMGDVQSVASMADTMLVRIDVPDTACALLRFQNGALGIIEATTATRPDDIEGSISILGEHGSVEIGGYFMNQLKTWRFSKKEEIDDKVFEDFSANPDVFAWNHTEYLKDIVDSIQKGKNGAADGRDAQRTVALIEAIKESARTKKEIFLNRGTYPLKMQNLSRN